MRPGSESLGKCGCPFAIEESDPIRNCLDDVVIELQYRRMLLDQGQPSRNIQLILVDVPMPLHLGMQRRGLDKRHAPLQSQPSSLVMLGPRQVR
jgi:hypothetical protein